MGISSSTDKIQTVGSSPRSPPTMRASTVIHPSTSPSAVPIPSKDSRPDYSSPVMMIISPTTAAPIYDTKTGYYVPTAFTWKHGGKLVYLFGSFNNWKERIPMERTGSGEFICTYNIPPGVHHYGYFVDEEWKIDPESPTAVTVDGFTNNMIEVKEPIIGEKLTQMPVGKNLSLFPSFSSTTLTQRCFNSSW